MFLAGFTPLPFKLFTIASGIVGFNVVVFFLICLFTRGLRFFIVAYLSSKFGSSFGSFLEKKGTVWASIISFVVILLIVVFYLIIKTYV